MGRKSSARSLNIYMNGMLVGTWWNRAGKHELVYDREWINSGYARPLSLSLPLQPPDIEHTGNVVQNYFDNLLPDSLELRKRIQERFGTSSHGVFELLTEIGRDCVGAIQLLPPGYKPVDYTKIRGVVLKEKEIGDILRAIPAGRQFGAWNKDDFRISIAGVQEKTALLFHKGHWLKPTGSTPTTHILKLSLGRMAQFDMSSSIENEWFSSRVAAFCGIPVAKNEIKVFDGAKALVVERFDRRMARDRQWIIRLPQEDMCQASGIPSGLKYEADGGPGILKIMNLLLGSESFQEDRNIFFKTLIIFWLLAAPDGHAKNYSIFIGEKGKFRLTPMYDIMSAWPVMGPGKNMISPQKLKMAMAVYGKNRHYVWKKVTRAHWEETGSRSGLEQGQVKAILEELIERVPASLDKVQSIMPVDFPLTVAESISAGVLKTLRLLKG